MQLGDLPQLAGQHDLRLSAWGPYTKRYIGASHVPDVAAGLRFDLSVFSGLYRRAVNIPNVMWESGYHPWGGGARPLLLPPPPRADLDRSGLLRH